MNPQAKRNALLSGLGFYKLSERRQKQIVRFLLISAGVHLVGLAIFGSVVVMKAMQEEKTVFVAPPPLKTYEPKKLEHQVKVQKRQRSASRPAAIPRLVAARTSTFALPEIKADPRAIKTSFQPKFKQVTGTGIGMGLGTGLGLGGFGTGVSEFNFFGIRGRGDRIAILVDVSVSMVEDKRDGFKGFQRVRDRLNQVIAKLNEKALFNVIVFADAGQVLEGEMLIASEENKRKGQRFLDKYNTDDNNCGLDSGNIRSADVGLRALGGTTRLDLALTAAFQQNADTILIISDGEPRVRKEVSQPEVSAEQRAAYQAQLANWHKEHDDEIAAYEKAAANANVREVRVWVPPSPRTEGHAKVEGHWETRRVSDIRVARPHPPGPPWQRPSEAWWSLQDFLEHFKILHTQLYVKRGKKLPVVHCIGYAIDERGGDFLKALTKEYKGVYRRISGL